MASQILCIRMQFLYNDQNIFADKQALYGFNKMETTSANRRKINK